MIRSTRFVFVPFCLLAQGVRAVGIVKHHAAVVTPVVKILLEAKVNIIQMMCPELIFDGFYRKPCGRLKYDTLENHKVCREVAKNTVGIMEMLLKNDQSIDAVLGIDFSPSCAVNKLTGGGPKRFINGEGIYTEELRKLMNSKGIKVPFIGVQIYHIDYTEKALKKILKGDEHDRGRLE